MTSPPVPPGVLLGDDPFLSSPGPPEPSEVPGPSGPSEVPGPSEPGELIRVLIVDDDARVRAAVRETVVLEADLLVVGAAADAATALALVSGTGPCVALVDVLLPDDRTGLALVRSMSRRPECSVVAMSVRSDLRRAALAAGAVAFIEKGADIDVLLRSVRTADQQNG